MTGLVREEAVAPPLHLRDLCKGKLKAGHLKLNPIGYFPGKTYSTIHGDALNVRSPLVRDLPQRSFAMTPIPLTLKFSVITAYPCICFRNCEEIVDEDVFFFTFYLCQIATFTKITIYFILEGASLSQLMRL